MISVSVTVQGTDKELAKLKSLGAKLYDFRGAMQDIGEEVTKYYSGQGFASQGGVFDNVWPSLSPVYAKLKAKNYPGRSVLVKTGRLQDSFRASSTSKSVVVTNTAPYMAYHQSTEPRSKMPYRPIMKVNDDVKSIVRQIIQEDVTQKLRTL